MENVFYFCCMERERNKTPEEKVKALIEKFSPLITKWDYIHDAPRSEDEIIADTKKCVLIAVENEYTSLRKQLDDIMNLATAMQNVHDIIELRDMLIIEEHHVKAEIEKL